MPHQQIHRAGLRRNLILDDTVIAMERCLGGIADGLAADGEGSLSCDQEWLL
jgi:hypothetical protein